MPSPRPSHFKQIYNCILKYKRSMYNKLNTFFGITTPQFNPIELAASSHHHHHHHHHLTIPTLTTVKLLKYADFILTPLLQNIPSYIQDTTDFMKRTHHGKNYLRHLSAPLSAPFTRDQPVEDSPSYICDNEATYIV